MFRLRKSTTSFLLLKAGRMIRTTSFLYISHVTLEFMQNEVTDGDIIMTGRGGKNLYELGLMGTVRALRVQKRQYQKGY